MKVHGILPDTVILRDGDIHIEVEESQITIIAPVKNAINQRKLLDIIEGDEEDRLLRLKPEDVVSPNVLSKIKLIVFHLKS